MSNKTEPRPVFIDGKYLIDLGGGELITITPSAKKKRGRSRWWRAVSHDVPLTEWLATPRIVLHALRNGTTRP